MEDTMKHATRTQGLARQAGGVLLNLAHGALLAGGLMGMATVASDRLDPVSVNYADTRAAVSTQPGSFYAGLAAEALEAAHPAGKSPQAVQAVEDDNGLSPEMVRVRDWVSDRYGVSDETLEPALAAAEEAGRHRGIDPLLIVAIMAVESSFNPRAVSNMGAQGLMQVIPRFHKDKIGSKRGKNALFDPEFNIHVGTQVLHEGLARYGDMQRALQYYNGSLGDTSMRYTRKVMAIKKRLVAAAAGRLQLASAG
ncbi:lytic transglycosylase domain-containing protein [Thauera sinica]|uniref:Lytic transglycosylase domain-containing protein n=1 Tax=Thauera sinica TaxID=2665146 RepID=A0ABW1ATZ8_9RHOO|nr:transglycosylase SLT domain-containing protein [Thauera sp. K11]ATE58813.1 lytic transglycosylase [Thauera sp. K11]